MLVNSGGDPWVWVPSWEPGAAGRAVRHRVANLLAPIAVAAELLDGDSDELLMLQRATTRLRHQLHRVGDLLRPPHLQLQLWSVGELLTSLELPGDGSGQVLVDAAVLAERLCDELSQHGEVELSGGTGTVTLPEGGTQTCLILRSEAAVEPLSRDALEMLAVPLSSSRSGCGLALVAQTTHLHGGWVRGRTDAPVIEALIPLLPTS